MSPDTSTSEREYLPKMRMKSRRRYLFVAIDPAGTPLGFFIRMLQQHQDCGERASLFEGPGARLPNADFRPPCLDRQRKEFTDRLFGCAKRAQSGKHEFDQASALSWTSSTPNTAQITSEPNDGNGGAV